MAIKDKLITLEELDDATNPSNYTTCPTPYNGNEQIPMMLQGNRYATTVNELLSAAGSGGGTSQGALVNYVKNCGTISSLPITINDSNITSDMVVIESVLGTPSAQTGDWTITTANGSVTISGSISGSTTLMLYFGVGMTTAPSIMTNLASTSSDNILKTVPRPGVMGVLGLSNGGTGQNASNAADLRSKLGITPENIGAVAKSSDTMTGNLKIEHTGDTFVAARSTDTGVGVYLDSEPSGKHGIWSTGYYADSAFVSNGKFIIARNTNGNVFVADHYNKDEVDSAIQQSMASSYETLSTNLVSGSVTLFRSGKVRIMSIDDGKLASDGVILLNNALPTSDCPSALTNGTIRYGTNTTSAIWIRPTGTLGGTTIPANNVITGQLVWIAN